MKIKCRNSEFKHGFYTSPQIDSTKDSRSRGRKTMLWRSTLVLNTVSEVSGLVIHQLTNLCGFYNRPPPVTENPHDGLYLIR